jgi:hypothetical protein
MRTSTNLWMPILFAVVMLLGGIYLVDKDVACGGAIKFTASVKEMSISAATGGGILCVGAMALVLVIVWVSRPRLRINTEKYRKGIFGESWDVRTHIDPK